jgi:hypothetical protein
VNKRRKTKGLAALNRQKRLPLIMILSAVLLIFLGIQAVRSIKIYIVYSSGILPFFLIGLIITAIAVLYFKR